MIVTKLYNPTELPYQYYQRPVLSAERNNSEFKEVNASVESQMKEKLTFTIFTKTIMHLIYPPSPLATKIKIA